MDYSKRIEEIVNTIEYDTIADIGTDHGYIPVLAVKTEKAKKAVACDINRDCLNKAVKSINENYLSDKIEARLGDGLSPLKPYEAETVIMAGIGGLLTCDIIKNGLEKLCGVKQLILSPQSNIPDVRRVVHKAGFLIKREIIIKDMSKFYVIMNCEKGQEVEYSEEEYFLGKNIDKNNVYKEFVNQQSQIIEKALNNIKADGVNESSKSRYNELTKMYMLYKGEV